MKSFRSKPVGWVKDSYRHYLAAKFGSAPRRYSATVGSQLSLETSSIPQYRPETAVGRFLKGISTEHKLRRLADVQKGAAEFERRRDLAKEAADTALSGTSAVYDEKGKLVKAGTGEIGQMEYLIGQASRRTRSPSAAQAIELEQAEAARTVLNERMNKINERMAEVENRLNAEKDDSIRAGLRDEFAVLDDEKKRVAGLQSVAKQLATYVANNDRALIKGEEGRLASIVMDAFNGYSSDPYGALDRLTGGTDSILNNARKKERGFGGQSASAQPQPAQAAPAQAQEAPVQESELAQDLDSFNKRSAENAAKRMAEKKMSEPVSETVDLSDVEALEVAAADADEARMQRDIGKASLPNKLGDLKQQVRKQNR